MCVFYGGVNVCVGIHVGVGGCVDGRVTKDGIFGSDKRHSRRPNAHTPSLTQYQHILANLAVLCLCSCSYCSRIFICGGLCL